MKDDRAYKIMLSCAFFFRLILALLSQRANDEHIEVVRLLKEAVASGSHPEALSFCKECYHPKLYHYTCAFVNSVFGLESVRAQMVSGQLINAAVGMIGLYVAVRFVRESAFSRYWKLTACALVCFNPSLASINVQMTNDTFVITLSAMASIRVLSFLKERRIGDVVAFSLWTLLALLGKGNALILLGWILAVLAADTAALLFRQHKNKNSLLALPLFLFIVAGGLAFVPRPLSVYAVYFEQFDRHRGPGFNFTPAPLPYFFEESTAPYRRPGITSIYQGYLTFKFFELLKKPFISNSGPPSPIHRISLWSQLYGRVHFSFFDQWVWRRADSASLYLGRALMFAGFLPTFLFLCGMVIIAVEQLGRLKQAPSAAFSMKLQWIFALQATAFIAGIISFTLAHRDFCAMKDIYIFPAIISFLYCFMKGGEYIDGLLGARESLRFGLQLIVLSLPILYMVNLILMVGFAGNWF